MYIGTCYIVILLIIQALARTETHQWIDPHSPDGVYKPIDTCNCKNPLETVDDVTMLHYQRTLGLLLNALEWNPDTGSYTGKMVMDMPSEYYEFIKAFSVNAKQDSYSWNKLDLILSEIYSKSKVDAFSDMVIGWKERFMYNINSREALIALGILACLVFTYNLLNARIRVGTILKYLFIFGYIIDFAFTWMRLLQGDITIVYCVDSTGSDIFPADAAEDSGKALHEKDLERMAKMAKYNSLPPECDPHSMGIYQYMIYKLTDGGEKCKEYHVMKFQDDFWHVNPIKVFGTQIGDLIQTPANAIGTAFGQFMKSIVAQMPWYTYFFVPLLLIFILVIACILLSFLTDTSFSFNLLYLVQFHFGKGKREQISNVFSRKKRKALSRGAERPAIENIKDTRQIKESSKPMSCEDVSIEEIGPEDSLNEGNRSVDSKLKQGAIGDRSHLNKNEYIEEKAKQKNERGDGDNCKTDSRTKGRFKHHVEKT